MSYYKINRGILDHEVFADSPYSEREAWIWMIGEAAWKDHEKPINGQRVKIKRGQFTHSLRFMSRKFQWSKDKVKRFMDKLVLWDMIQYDNETGQNITTLCNYSQYQGGETDTETPTETPTATTPRRKRDKKEEIQERQKKNNIPDGVSENVWKDFVAHRKAKKAPVTDLVVNRIRAEAKRAGWTLNEALEEICARGWTGFKADWVERKSVAASNPDRKTLMDFDNNWTEYKKYIDSIQEGEQIK